MICAKGWIPPLAHILIVSAAIETIPPGQRPGGTNDVGRTFPKHRTPAMPKDILSRNQRTKYGCFATLTAPTPGHPPARKGGWGEEWGVKAVHTPVRELVS
jgi:hypothetical protein